MGKTLRSSTMIAAIAGSLMAGQSLALSVDDFVVSRTGELVKLCSAPEDDRYRDPARGFCLGYLDATWDYHQALTKGEDFTALACPDAGVTRDDALRVFLQWAEANSDNLDETPVQGVMRAFAAKWPCTDE